MNNMAKHMTQNKLKTEFTMSGWKKVVFMQKLTGKRHLIQ